MGFVISLIFIGLLLLLAELIIFPGVGLSGILGLAAIVASCVYSFMKISTTAGFITLAVNFLLIILLIVVTLRSKTWSRLTLRTKIESRAGQDSEKVSVGDRGITLTRISPMGTARIGNQTLEVKSAEGIIDPETPVEVTMVDDGKIYISKQQ